MGWLLWCPVSYWFTKQGTAVTLVTVSESSGPILMQVLTDCYVVIHYTGINEVLLLFPCLAQSSSTCLLWHPYRTSLQYLP